MLELGRVELNNRLKDGGRKKTIDGPFNSVGRRVVVVVEAGYFICVMCQLFCLRQNPPKRII